MPHQSVSPFDLKTPVDPTTCGGGPPRPRRRKYQNHYVPSRTTQF